MSSRIYPAGPEYALLIFSSHSWAYGHHRNGLHDLLAPDWSKGIEYHDLSVPSAHPLQTYGDNIELAEQLSERIRQCDVLLIMAGMYANFSDWMRAEIDFAIAHRKPILAIAPNGQERIPSTATRFSRYPVVRWRGASLREAILNAIDSNVRSNFLAAKQWRLDEFIESLLPPPAPAPLPDFSFLDTLPRRRTAAAEYLDAWAPPPLKGVGLFGSAFGALERATPPSAFDYLAPTEAEAYGFLDPLFRKP